MNTTQVTIFVFFCINATLSGNFFIRFLIEKKPKSSLNKHIFILLASSVVWSLGMGLMSIQTSLMKAYVYRTIGILGTFIFMASVQVALCILSEIPKKSQKILNAIALLGLPIFCLYSIPGQTIFIDSNYGMTFFFKPGIITTIYSLYFFFVSLNIFIITLYTVRHNQIKRTVVAGKRLIIVELCIFTGAIFDMILPTLGIAAFPGSAITHFWGVVIFWLALHEMFKSQLTVANMSEYVYYSLSTPVLIFNSNYKLAIINNSSSLFCNIDEGTFLPGEIDINELFETNRDIFDFENDGYITKSICKSNGANCEIIINKIKDAYNDIIGYICLVNDLTEHNLIISRLEQAKLAADAANTSKSVFLANMSHEIRTPMNAILGFSDIALMEDIDNKSREYFKEIKQAGNVLLSLINEILNISKIELGKNEIENANYKPARILNDVELITRSNAIKKGLKFNVNIDPNFPEEVYGDANKIREILLNILGNSVKYTNKGGIEFVAKTYTDLYGNTMFHFVISDTGIGIKAEDIPTIFDKFARVEKKLNSTTEGTGLGLSINKGLVDLLGGTIEVSSEYGVGSSFSVDIPQKVIDSSPMKPVSEDKPTSNHLANSILEGSESLHFLIVDDTTLNLKVASKLLSFYNAEIDTCTSGMEAIEKCKICQYNIIFMDHMMPEMDGIEAMKKIRLLPGYAPGSINKIVALTANAVDGARDMLIAEGFDDFISKPMKKEILDETITRVLSN